MAKKRYFYNFIQLENNGDAGLPMRSENAIVSDTPYLRREWEDGITGIDNQIREDMPFYKKGDKKI